MIKKEYVNFFKMENKTLRDERGVEFIYKIQKNIKNIPMLIIFNLF